MLASRVVQPLRLAWPSATVCARALSDDAAALRRTPLWEMHREMGATMTGFGGWDMPLKYPGKEGGIMGSHLHTRAAAGLFDVSHMVPLRFHGKDRAAFMETILPSDILGLPENMGTLSSLPNGDAGLIDDCICTNAGDHMYLVINAGHEDKDIPHIEERMSAFDGDVSMEVVEGGGLLAIQGPKAVDVMARLCPDVDFAGVAFMSGHKMTVDGAECFVTRSGYTGEDGFVRLHQFAREAAAAVGAVAAGQPAGGRQVYHICMHGTIC
jgi:aminomethyltransferase